MTISTPLSPVTTNRAPASTMRAITVADNALQSNALGLLLSTAPDIEVVAHVANVVFAREMIVRTRPDVVVVRCAEDALRRYRALLDLQLPMPHMGFVLILADRADTSARRPPVDRAVVVLSAHFALADLLTSVRAVGETERVSWDSQERAVGM